MKDLIFKNVQKIVVFNYLIQFQPNHFLILWSHTKLKAEAINILTTNLMNLTVLFYCIFKDIKD